MRRCGWSGKATPACGNCWSCPLASPHCLPDRAVAVVQEVIGIMHTLLASSATVTVSGKEYSYLPRWSAQRLLPDDGYLALDTETEVVDLKRCVPRLALASASAGDEASCLIHPDDVGRFVLAHKSLHFVCHNAAFDFWVVEDHLRQRGEEQARAAWWDIAARNRLHDSMLLDMLVRLARDDSYPDMRDLAVVARDYTGLAISKDDPYRRRYGEIIGQDWGKVEKGFFDYAIRDALVVRPTYRAIRKQALALVEEFGRSSSDILPMARQQFGLLTEAIQVKKAIALAQITRNGISVDLEWVRKTEAELRKELFAAVAAPHAVCPIYKVDADGNFITTGKTSTPAFDDNKLRDQLASIKEQIEGDTDTVLRIPLTKKGISCSVKVWSDYELPHPFLGHWIRAQSLAKLLQFFTLFRVANRQPFCKVHPSYTVMVRTGRTSCSTPNIQQIPKDSASRQSFVASPGYFLLTVDAKFIEMVTFAATA